MYGTKIQQIRLARGFTQAYMAQLLSIGQEVYCRMEKNQKKIPDELLHCIAKILGVSTIDIKSKTPIVMQLGNSIAYEELMNQKDEIITDLTRLLQQKENQVTKLLDLIHNAGGGVSC